MFAVQNMAFVNNTANYAIQNALLQICKQTNTQLKKVDRKDIEQITEILRANYRKVELIFPDVSFFKFKYLLGVINGQYSERD